MSLFKEGDTVKVVNHRWKGSPNLPVGTIGFVDRVRPKGHTLPVEVWFAMPAADDDDDEVADGFTAYFEPEDLEFDSPEMMRWVRSFNNGLITEEELTLALQQEREKSE